MCSDSPAPDPLIGQSAMANAQLSKEAMDYYREKDAAQAPRQARMDDLTEKLANQQIASSQFNDQQARKMFERYESTGIPIENAVNAEAMNYDGKAALDQAAGQASNDVATSVAAAREAQTRNLARMGVNPADGRALAAGNDMATTGALAQAAAMNGARNQRQQMGTMLRKDAASAARGMPGTAAQTFGTSMAAGGQAAGAVGSSIASANSITGTMGQGFGIGIQGNNSAASIMNQLNSAQTAAASAQGSQTASLAGTAATIGIAI